MKKNTQNLGLNDAEQFVAENCLQSFLSLWTYPNPQGKQGKELCDLLVVCGPHVIIISVKHIKYQETEAPEIGMDRWERKAIDESVKQIFKAERWLKLEELKEHVITSSGKAGITIPSEEQAQIHRIAVAIGGENKVSFSSGLFDDKGTSKYVHVFDSISFGIIIRELDTITDFVKYLIAKENLQASVIMEGEESLLAVYLQNCYQFPEGDTFFLDGDLWKTFSETKEYQKIKKDNEISYAWDNLINTVAKDHFNGTLLGNLDIDEVAITLRSMALENRFDRRQLGEALFDFFEKNQLGQVRSRFCYLPGRSTYVFLCCSIETEREERKTELKHRCFVARYLCPDRQEVIGIATETPKKGQGCSFDVLCLKIPELNNEIKNIAVRIQKELGYFKNFEPLSQNK